MALLCSHTNQRRRPNGPKKSFQPRLEVLEDSRGGDVASRGGSRSVAFGEDAAPGIEQGSPKPVGPTKGMHGLPAGLPALQKLPPMLLLGGVALPVRHGWHLPDHGDPTTPCKMDFAGRLPACNMLIGTVQPVWSDR